MVVILPKAAPVIPLIMVDNKVQQANSPTKQAMPQATTNTLRPNIKEALKDIQDLHKEVHLPMRRRNLERSITEQIWFKFYKFYSNILLLLISQ